MLTKIFVNSGVLLIFYLLIFYIDIFFLFFNKASHGGFIFSYAVEKYDMKPAKFSSTLKNDSKTKLSVTRHHHQQDAYITACFWAFLSIGRLISIFISTKFSASFMIFVDIVILIRNFQIKIVFSFSVFLLL